MELLIGCGADRRKRVGDPDRPEFTDLVTLDINPDVGADVVWDLNALPLPFADDTFDEIHAYDVLEHVGRQGDWRFFFAQFADFWRILKPGGALCGVSPLPHSPWAWADPGHTRIIAPQSFHFLAQPNYGRAPMTDYRGVYSADFDLVHSQEFANGQHSFALEAVKPARLAGIRQSSRGDRDDDEAG